ncbi:MAG: S8 family serine peptidase [Flavihumibacter sp.]
MPAPAAHMPASSLRDDRTRPKFTGRKLVLLNTTAKTNVLINQAKKASLRFASSLDFNKAKSGDFLHTALQQADGILFDKMKIAVINETANEPMKHLLASSSTARNFLLQEPERYVYAFAGKKKQTTDFKDNTTASWAMQAIEVLQSKYSGKGINVAVLDTGIDTAHPDLKMRIKRKKSFVRGQQVTDLNGHGTHCGGLIAGDKHATRKFRYGVAPQTNLFVGKVLDNQGSGTDSSILAGIEWAMENKCRIISMSLGAEAAIGETYSQVYEAVAAEALKNNCLIIAAAGNESERASGYISPVGHPANCPSIMAVAALDQQLKVADFSCGGLNPDGGQIDVSAPGVDIWSTWKNKGYRRESGTSMATPIVAGIAALLAEQDNAVTAAALWMKLTQQAKRLQLPATDVGAGLIIAPR